MNSPDALTLTDANGKQRMTGEPGLLVFGLILYKPSSEELGGRWTAADWDGATVTGRLDGQPVAIRVTHAGVDRDYATEPARGQSANTIYRLVEAGMHKSADLYGKGSDNQVIAAMDDFQSAGFDLAHLGAELVRILGAASQMRTTVPGFARETLQASRGNEGQPVTAFILRAVTGKASPFDMCDDPPRAEAAARDLVHGVMLDRMF